MSFSAQPYSIPKRVQQEKEVDVPAASLHTSFLYTLVSVNSVGLMQLFVPISVMTVPSHMQYLVIPVTTHLVLKAIPDSCGSRALLTPVLPLRSGVKIG